MRIDQQEALSQLVEEFDSAHLYILENDLSKEYFHFSISINFHQ
jgi:hypothetical protein